MKKIYIFTAVLALVGSVVLAGPVAALAQYSYGTSYAPVYTPAYAPQYVNGAAYPVNGTNSACVNLTSNLYAGLRDATTAGQVSTLQAFLIAQRYLMIVVPSGYFGALTHQAVVLYQTNHGLTPNGFVDATTRASIQTVSCGGGAGYINGAYGNGYTGGNVYNSGYYNNGYNNYYGVPVLSSLSVTSGAVGTSVTVYGSGFDYSNNTVNFNGVTLAGIASYNSTSLVFTVPQVYNTYNNTYDNTYNNQYCSTYPYTNCSNNTGTYSVSVTTSHGTSNSLSFNVTSNNNCYNNGYTNNIYPYNNNCYNNGSIYNQSQPSLSAISPNSGQVGTQVVLWGSGFASTGDTVHFGNGGTMNVASSVNGAAIYFSIPSYISPCNITSGYGVACPAYAQQVTPGTYPVYVSNVYGQSSTLYFTVTY